MSSATVAMPYQAVEANRQSRLELAHRIILTGLFLSLVWKKDFFLYADWVYHRLPIHDAFFPAWLRSADVLRWDFLLTLVLIGISGFAQHAKTRIACGYLLLATLSVLCLHQGSYNDMTFVTAWWTSLWSLWLVHQMPTHKKTEGEEASVLRKAAFLSRLIVSVILLGGAVGKWTGEYWSGHVLYEIYFHDRDFWVFNGLRQCFDEAALREIAKWYSRQVVVVETLCGIGLWALPPRVAAAIGVTVLMAIALFSNFLLFSVMSCVIALASVGFLVSSENSS